jgi:hypothetical protein
MKALFILLEQSLAGAVVTIILLLLVAALIAFVTAHYYYKSVYTPVIKGLEADKEELNRQISLLNSEIAKLNARSLELENIISEKNKEIEFLKNPPAK